MPQFFAVDGPTGVGKSETMKYLKAHLASRLPEHLASRIVFCKDSEGSPLAKQVRELARSGVHAHGDPKEQVLLFWTSRLATCKKLARLIQGNKIPITLRFGASTWAHQIFYHDRVDDLDDVHWNMVKMCVVEEGLSPPHYLMLTAPAEVLDARVSAGPKGSPFPRECSLEVRLAFLARLQAGYEEYARHPTQKATIIDASVSVDEMGEAAIAAILSQFEAEGLLLQRAA
jgi:thymidylate kinase